MVGALRSLLSERQNICHAVLRGAADAAAPAESFHWTIMRFSARFGTTAVSRSSSFVRGEVRLPVANHASIALRS